MEISLDAILTAISAVGFPIVAFGAMYWMCYRVIHELQETLAKNTQALTELRNAVKMNEEAGKNERS